MLSGENIFIQEINFDYVTVASVTHLLIKFFFQLNYF